MGMTIQRKVAPLAGAWIEIRFRILQIISATSLPLRERGLKFSQAIDIVVIVLSLPLRERGLKCVALRDLCLLVRVAPLAGAWIEMSMCLS